MNKYDLSKDTEDALTIIGTAIGTAVATVIVKEVTNWLERKK